MSNVEKIWREFQTKAFPEGCAGVEVGGIELVSLDTFTAGCIDTFVQNKGCLDASRVKALKRCAGELGVVVKRLDGEAKDYFEQLRSLADQVLRMVDGN